jgi:hypothetical protein
MNSRKNALKTESHMNEIAEKHFKYTDPQKRLRILLMKTKKFLHLFCVGLDYDYF